MIRCISEDKFDWKNSRKMFIRLPAEINIRSNGYFKMLDHQILQVSLHQTYVNKYSKCMKWFMPFRLPLNK